MIFYLAELATPWEVLLMQHKQTEAALGSISCQKIHSSTNTMKGFHPTQLFLCSQYGIRRKLCWFNKIQTTWFHFLRVCGLWQNRKINLVCEEFYHLCTAAYSCKLREVHWYQFQLLLYVWLMKQEMQDCVSNKIVYSSAHSPQCITSLKENEYFRFVDRDEAGCRAIVKIFNIFWSSLVKQMSWPTSTLACDNCTLQQIKHNLPTNDLWKTSLQQNTWDLKHLPQSIFNHVSNWFFSLDNHPVTDSPPCSGHM